MELSYMALAKMILAKAMNKTIINTRPKGRGNSNCRYRNKVNFASSIDCMFAYYTDALFSTQFSNYQGKKKLGQTAFLQQHSATGIVINANITF